MKPDVYLIKPGPGTWVWCLMNPCKVLSETTFIRLTRPTVSQPRLN